MKKLLINKKCQQGFSIVELMIAMMLGLFLSAGLVNVFVSGKMTYVADEESARMQENARYALRYVSRELNMSSFFGGLVRYDTVPKIALGGTDCETEWATDIQQGLEVVDNFQGGTATTTINTDLGCVSNLSTDSDVIAVKRTADQPSAEDGTKLVGSVDGDQYYLRIQDYGGTAGFEYVGSGGDFASLAAQVDYWKYYAKVMFVRDFSNTAGDNIPALCVAALDGSSMQTDCLAEGVEALQVEFGVDSDTDGTVNYFVTAPTADESQQIISAKIYVLMRSVGTTPNYINDTRYTLGTTAINGGNAFNDSFQRRIFSTTVKLRNPVTL